LATMRSAKGCNAMLYSFVNIKHNFYQL